MPWTIYSQRHATQRAARALIEDPARSNELIAEAAQCGSTTIGTVRAKLEQIGVIPAVEPADRLAQPRPQQPSRTRNAIALLGPDATPRQVADLAGVSMAAAWKALRKLNPPLADAAAATDAIAVVKMPRQLTDAAAAADALTVQAAITCPVCTTVFHVSTADQAARHRRFCSDDCRDADAAAHNRATRPRIAEHGMRHAPQIPDYPAAPDFSRGLCAHVAPGQRHWWTSSDPILREAAANICLGCPILIPCAEFSLALPVTDSAVWAGMSQAERLRRKREERRLAATEKPPPTRG